MMKKIYYWLFLQQIWGFRDFKKSWNWTYFVKQLVPNRVPFTQEIILHSFYFAGWKKVKACMLKTFNRMKKRWGFLIYQFVLPALQVCIECF